MGTFKVRGKVSSEGEKEERPSFSDGTNQFIGNKIRLAAKYSQ
jgi:hypothetical protein